MSEERDPRHYLDWAKDELTSIFRGMELDGDNDAAYELDNLASGFNVLLRYAEKGMMAEEAEQKECAEEKADAEKAAPAPMNAEQALSALLQGKRIRLRTWDKGQFAYLDEKGDLRNQGGDYASLQPIHALRSVICSKSEAETYHDELAMPLWEEAGEEQTFGSLLEKTSEGARLLMEEIRDAGEEDNFMELYRQLTGGKAR